VSISPGLYRAMQLRPAEAITSESSVLVVSVPSPAENGWVPLADTESEAQTVAANFHSARWLRGSGATLNVIRQQIRGVSLFHFAGHAVASPERNGLLLDERDSRTQRARLISADSLPTRDTSALQLVVLSACQTENGPGPEASGNESLVRGLLRAGVPHVIASRWNIDSAETAAFMKQFYARLLAGEDVPDSLRSAELTLAAQPVSAHPYYWAAFEGQGL
jgi:CHAT domain-containing protein